MRKKIPIDLYTSDIVLIQKALIYYSKWNNKLKKQIEELSMRIDCEVNGVEYEV